MTDRWTRHVRETTRVRRLTTLGAIVIGLGLASVHWLGFLAGGVLVSLPALSARRGLLSGLGFGVLATAWFLAAAALAGTLSAVLGTGLPAVLAISTPPLLASVGALARSIY
jgi:hypothetical protein